MAKNSPFDQIESLSTEQGAGAAIDFLVDHFRDSDEHHSLFEALKMQARHSLGLPILYGQGADQLNESEQRTLEDRLLIACREVGTRMFQQGKLREGWLYLQPVGDRKLNRELMSAVVVNQENADELVEIAFAGGADPETGFQVILERFGTCNAITTIDTQAGQFDRATRINLAEMLVNHLYRELVANVVNHVTENEGQRPATNRLSELLHERSWLTQSGGHHIDTTHLASIMRIGRIAQDPDVLKMLVELAEYGIQLQDDFQYPGEPPFESTYGDHLVYYRALANPTDPQTIGKAIAHFEKKTTTTDREQYGLIATETLVELLYRTGNTGQAIQLATEQLAGQTDVAGVSPNIFEMAEGQDELAQVAEYCREHQDLLGFGISIIQQQLTKNSGPIQ